MTKHYPNPAGHVDNVPSRGRYQSELAFQREQMDQTGCTRKPNGMTVCGNPLADEDDNWCERCNKIWQERVHGSRT